MSPQSADVAWEPPSWNTAGSIGTYVLKSLPGGLVGHFETSEAAPGAVRHWLVGWFREKRAVITQRAPDELAWPESYLYLVICRTSDDPSGRPPEAYQVREFGIGSEPSCPETWPAVALGELLDHAVKQLGGHLESHARDNALM